MAEPRDTREKSEGDVVLRLHDAAFGYGGRAVVSGLDLEVRRGESLAVLGPNGSGKSTLIRGLLGLNDHLGGVAEVLGYPLRGVGGAGPRRSALGYVPQRHTLSSSVVATVGEVVSIGRLPHLGLFGRLRAADRAIIAEALATVGLSGHEKDDVTHLSGGQQRRVLVARALAAQPEILVMDEPTAGVDESNQRVLAAAMIELAARGVTLLTVTHELDALAAAVDRAVVMGGGRIRYDGDPAGIGGVPGVTLGHDHHHHEELVPHPPSVHGPRPAPRGRGVPLPGLRLGDPKGNAHA